MSFIYAYCICQLCPNNYHNSVWWSLFARSCCKTCKSRSILLHSKLVFKNFPKVTLVYKEAHPPPQLWPNAVKSECHKIIVPQPYNITVPLVSVNNKKIIIISWHLMRDFLWPNAERYICPPLLLKIWGEDNRDSVKDKSNSK